MAMEPHEPTSELFWDLAAELQAGDDRVHEGTIMSSNCLRVNDEFLAMPHHKGPGLVVKLPRERVDGLIADGTGQPFAPAGKVFREWVLVEAPNEDQWRSLLTEGIDFVAP